MFRKLHEPLTNAVTILVDGEAVQAELGEMVAMVLMRRPEPWARVTAISGTRRAPYCMMGVCFECVAEVDGIASVQTCLKIVADGMRVNRQIGKRSLGD